MQSVVNGREVFRLRIGPFAGMTDAIKGYALAKALGHSDLSQGARGSIGMKSAKPRRMVCIASCGGFDSFAQ